MKKTFEALLKKSKKSKVFSKAYDKELKRIKKIQLVNCEVPLNIAIKFLKKNGRVGYKKIPVKKKVKESDRKYVTMFLFPVSVHSVYGQSDNDGLLFKGMAQRIEIVKGRAIKKVRRTV